MNGSIFQILASIFTRHNVRPVLVGGYAINAYKIQRMTFDIDFMLTLEECKKIEPDILSLGYSIFNRTAAFVQYKSDRSGLRDLDLLIGDKNTVDRLVEQGKEVSIAGEKFIVPSAVHLIEMKLHAMSGNKKKREIKDLPDNGLSLPVIKGEMLPPRERSLDEIDSWIGQDYALFSDRKRYEREKRELSVDKKFVL